MGISKPYRPAKGRMVVESLVCAEIQIGLEYEKFFK